MNRLSRVSKLVEEDWEVKFDVMNIPPSNKLHRVVFSHPAKPNVFVVGHGKSAPFALDKAFENKERMGV